MFRMESQAKQENHKPALTFPSELDTFLDLLQTKSHMFVSIYCMTFINANKHKEWLVALIVL